MAALMLESVTVPGHPDLTGLVVDRGRPVAERLAPDAAAALLRAVAGVRDRRGPAVRIGRVVVDGTDVTGRAPHQRGIGYVPAGGGLLPQLTVRDNILDGAGDDELAAGVAEELARHLARNLDLTASLTLLPHELLNHEERLRVALARAAMREPAVRVLHLASPTASGDGTDGLTAADVDWLLRRLRQARPSGRPEPATLILTDRRDICERLRTPVPAACDPVPARGR